MSEFVCKTVSFWHFTTSDNEAEIGYLGQLVGIDFCEQIRMAFIYAKPFLHVLVCIL